MTDFAQPIVSASVYSGGQTDLLLDGVVREFWEKCPARASGGLLWTMRYAAAGQHLKLRIHGPKSQTELVARQLSEALDRFLSSVPKAQGSSKPDAYYPPIDPEDEQEEEQEAPSWRWTTFRPSPFVLGAVKLAEDKRLVGLFTRVQGAAAEVVLDVVRQRTDPNYAALRQSRFISLVLEGLKALGMPPPQCQTYFEYHRDWLVRFLVARAKAPAVTAETTLAPLDTKLESQDGVLLALAQRIQSLKLDTQHQKDLRHWQEALEAYYSYVATFRSVPEYDLDPYAPDNTHLPVFKALQGCCNQFGLRLSNELYVYHLLARAALLAS